MPVIIIDWLLNRAPGFQVCELARQERRFFTDRVIIIDPFNNRLTLLIGIGRAIMAHRPIIPVFFEDNDAGIVTMGEERVRQRGLARARTARHRN